MSHVYYAIIVMFINIFPIIVSYQSFLALYHSSFVISDRITKLLAASSGKSSSKVAYVCSECGKEYVQWMGTCSACDIWGSIKEFRISKQLSNLDIRTKRVGTIANAKGKSEPWLSGATGSLIKMEQVNTDKMTNKIKVFSSELDRVLGGGLVSGSLILMAGEPGNIYFIIINIIL